MRLQKFLSEAGVASRREAEDYIRDGFVLVNGDVVTTLPVFVDPAQDVVVFKGARVKLRPSAYFIANKPKTVVCSGAARVGRLRVVDLLPELGLRLQPVGRLDPESTGLVLLTTDGDLAQRIAHPRYEIPKRYRVELRGRATDELIDRVSRGVHLAEGKARPADVQLFSATPDHSVVEVTVFDEFPRIVQRLFAKCGFEVKNLKRIAIGPLQLNRLPEGAVRELNDAEAESLRAVAYAARRGRNKRRRVGPRDRPDRPDRDPRGGRGRRLIS